MSIGSRVVWVDMTPQTLPNCTARDLPDNAPFWKREVTLAMVVSGTLLQSHAVGEKLEMIALADNADFICATWHGKHHSDIFSVSKERLNVEAALRVT
jgi:hypothetical protein